MTERKLRVKQVSEPVELSLNPTPSIRTAKHPTRLRRIPDTEDFAFSTTASTSWFMTMPRAAKPADIPRASNCLGWGIRASGNNTH